MTQEQRRFLKERLRNAIRAKSELARERMRGLNEEPKEVKAARKVVERWENRVYRANEKKRQKIHSAIDKQAAAIRELILFHDADKALAAVKAFEKSQL